VICTAKGGTLGPGSHEKIGESKLRVDTGLKAFEGSRETVVQKTNWLYPSNRVQARIMIRLWRCNARALRRPPGLQHLAPLSLAQQGGRWRREARKSLRGDRRPGCGHTSDTAIELAVETDINPGFRLSMVRLKLSGYHPPPLASRRSGEFSSKHSGHSCWHFEAVEAPHLSSKSTQVPEASATRGTHNTMTSKVAASGCRCTYFRISNLTAIDMWKERPPYRRISPHIAAFVKNAKGCGSQEGIDESPSQMRREMPIPSFVSRDRRAPHRTSS
jgi:hypothetical protein